MGKTIKYNPNQKEFGFMNPPKLRKPWQDKLKAKIRLAKLRKEAERACRFPQRITMYDVARITLPQGEIARDQVEAGIDRMMMDSDDPYNDGVRYTHD